MTTIWQVVNGDYRRWFAHRAPAMAHFVKLINDWPQEKADGLELVRYKVCGDGWSMMDTLVAALNDEPWVDSFVTIKEFSQRASLTSRFPTVTELAKLDPEDEEQE